MQALQRPQDLPAFGLYAGLQVAHDFIQQHIPNLQQQAKAAHKKATDKAASWRPPSQMTNQSTAEDVEDIPCTKSVRMFSTQQERQLAKLQVQAREADAYVAEAQQMVDRLLCKAQHSPTVSLGAAEGSVQLQLADIVMKPSLRMLVTQTLQCIEVIMESLRLAANKLLVLKMQTLDHMHAITIMCLLVKHEDDSTVRSLVDHAIRLTHSLSRGQLEVSHIGYDGGHMKNGRTQPTNLLQV